MKTQEEQNTLTIFDPSAEITVFEIDKIDRMIAEMNAHAESFVGDPTTPKGRAEIKSEAYKFSTLKTQIVRLANQACEEAKAIVTKTTAERLKFERACDANRDKIKAPAVEWEAKEEARKAKISGAVRTIREWGENLSAMDSKALRDRIATMSQDPTFDFAEFAELAEDTRKQTLQNLNTALLAREQYESEQAELARLRKEKEERDAADAKRAEEETEKKAEEQRKAAELKAAQDAKEKAEREAKEAEEREIQRKKDEAARIEAARKQAAQDAVAKLKSEQAEKEAEERRKAEREEANRIKLENEELARKADERHRKAIREEAKTALSALIVDKDNGYVSRIIQAIEDREIPHVTLNF